MGLVKRTYVDLITVIPAENLNAIQDAIIENEEAIEDQGEAIEGKYTKPSGGIPKTDLASGVQTSLDNADSAYQKPSGGIPKTDLASGVQTSLGKADTALQSSDIDNTLTVSGKAADAKKTGDEISDVRNTLSQLDQSMAYVESGNTASRTYVTRDFINWKGTLYKANKAIPATTAFSTGSGGNLDLVAGSGGGLNDLNSLNGVVKQLGSKTFVLEAAGYQYNASTILVSFPLPFLAGNTNYSVNISSLSLVGKGEQSLSNVRIESKGYGYVRLSITYSGTINTPYLVSCILQIFF